MFCDELQFLVFFFKALYIQPEKHLLKFLQVTTLATQTTTSTYLKMIQWLNVRAVRAIKASMFEGRAPLPALSPLPPLSLLIPLSLNLLSPSSLPLASSSSIPPPTQAGLRADVQTLSFRLGPHCQLRALHCPGSFFQLSPSSCGQRRPYKATFLLIHFCQFQHCHSNHFSGEWREAELAMSLAARTVLFGPSLAW